MNSQNERGFIEAKFKSELDPDDLVVKVDVQQHTVLVLAYSILFPVTGKAAFTLLKGTLNQEGYREILKNSLFIVSSEYVKVQLCQSAKLAALERIRDIYSNSDSCSRASLYISLESHCSFI